MTRDFFFDPLELILDSFHECFEQSEKTRLLGGAKEPFYQAAKTSQAYHQIFFVGDSSASALHEISHWCIAGIHRRTLDDYGYWYKPEGRTIEEQKQFEAIEKFPQAIEWILSSALGKNFYVSADNPRLKEYDLSDFRNSVRAQALGYLKDGVPKRAMIFLEKLFSKAQPNQKVNWLKYWRRVVDEGVLPF